MNRRDKVALTILQMNVPDMERPSFGNQVGKGCNGIAFHHSFHMFPAHTDTYANLAGTKSRTAHTGNILC
jgi:hypothetical protein